MGSNPVNIVLIGIFFLIIFFSGFWLRRAGKPYPGVIFNLHKLIALGTAVFLFLLIKRSHQAEPLDQARLITFVFLAIFFMMLVVTGGLSSLEKPAPKAVSIVHKVFPYITFVSSAVMLYLLFNKT